MRGGGGEGGRNGRRENGNASETTSDAWRCIVVDENAEADDDLFRFVMGKADTHRDAHLRLFIPRGIYNTSITEDILERLARRRRSPRLEKKKGRGRESRKRRRNLESWDRGKTCTV